MLNLTKKKKEQMLMILNTISIVLISVLIIGVIMLTIGVLLMLMQRFTESRLLIQSGTVIMGLAFISTFIINMLVNV